MRIVYHFLFLILFLPGLSIFGQEEVNCFLEDWEPKNAVIPESDVAEKPGGSPTVTVNILAADTIGKISNYMFGNAVAVWLGQNVNNPVLVEHLQKLNPSFIRFPGGSWSDEYFWNGIPSDIPNELLDGTTGQPKQFYPHSGPGQRLTFDDYLDLRDQIGAEGLITVNYAYARYGLSDDPVATAAHLAADWVRYDDGRTKFWEIGNENAGPWEDGFRIDTIINKDGQPAIINGALYGKHFKVFADSMKAAAAELGNTIYIGGQVIHYDGTNSWNIGDRGWNEGFFKEAGESVDFYVMHNYFGTSPLPASLFNTALTVAKENANFIKQDIIDKNAAKRPIAITEWNMTGGNGTQKIDTAKISIINGMQAVLLFNEFIKHGMSLASRWLVANWETDGMFYYGNNNSLLWNPRPDFYYVYYLPKFTGDHVINTSVEGLGVTAYASTFSSGHAGIIVINKNPAEQIVKISPKQFGYGEHFYVYSLNGGTDNSDYSLNVFINGQGPNAPQWGPIEDLEDIPAMEYSTVDEIKFTSPGRSVQYILLEPGNTLSVEDEKSETLLNGYQLEQNFPNPFNPITNIKFTLSGPGFTNLKIYDVLGNEVATLVNSDLAAGQHNVSFDASNLSSGVYYYTVKSNNFFSTKKMVLIK